MNRQKQEQRKSSFKKALSHEDGRRKREETTNEIRKSKQSEALQKKRQIFAPSSSVVDDSPAPTRVEKSFIDLVNSELDADQYEGTVAFRKLLSIEKNPPINDVIRSGVVPRIISFLHKSTHPKLRFEAAWAITNIASGDSEQTQFVLQHNVVPIFISLLSDADEELREQATWALGNIAGDSSNCRNFVLSNGIVAPLIYLINAGSSKITVIRNATWTLSNLVRGKPSPNYNLVSPFLEVLSRLIQHHDSEVMVDALWALSYLSDGSNEQIQSIINSGVVPRIISILGSTNPSQQTPALRVLGNIVTGDDKQTQYVIDCGAIPVFKALLSHTKKQIRKEAAWAFSNITAGDLTQTQMVIANDVIPILIKLIGSNSDFDVRKEAAYALSNATTWKNLGQIKYLMDVGIAAPITALLTAKDNKLVLVALEAIEGILATGEKATKNGDVANPFTEAFEEVQLIDRLEALQDHSDEEVYAKSLNLLEKYFDAEDVENENVAPATNAASNTYVFGSNSNTPVTFSF